MYPLTPDDNRTLPLAVPDPAPETQSFDLDAAMAALPPRTEWVQTIKGNAGRRLNECHCADVSDDLLREFACDVLGAERIRDQYLDTLRIVLGNQAHAERFGYVLEMNQRVSFASPKAMRNLIGQMHDAGISVDVPVKLGDGKRQTVQCFRPARLRRMHVWVDTFGDANTLEDLEEEYRLCEGMARYDPARHPSLQSAELPF